VLPRHFLFDFDGTLADSASLHDWAFRQTLAVAAPHCLAVFEYELLKGLPTRTAFANLGIVDGTELDWCIGRKQKLYREAVEAGRLTEYPGARALLRTILECGGKNFLVTSGSLESINLALERLDIGAYFNGVITSGDAKVGKPCPEPYLVCLQRFELPSLVSIAIEDAESGVLAAKGAGLRVIGVHNPSVAGIVDIYFASLIALGKAVDERDQRLYCDTA
jgi:HAD superfamily hydrolase (TIGR01509 family)